ncbi:MAG: alpha/beta fold hydrolase [Shewanella sp.]|nr:alpha/beta fold hydrolase [Shewanella sp.]MCF1430861.1 alpha/beta fold hydrolase [Shewanella sp.]MCF1439716.1 alpha/beta fold hydrolase [Shewanella sp.]MCF1457492.1 alpha/beta fold hydrolase [Shewanella sp.]
MSKPHVFSEEIFTGSKAGQQQLAAFWEQVGTGFISGSKGCNIAWCSIRHPHSNKAIVISNGRVESFLKYQELIFDLYQQGYSVYALDHRGQGLSGRMTVNPCKGHVGQFDDYVDDLHSLIQEIVFPARHKQLFLLGHSMGGCIGTLYLQKHPDTFKAAAFSAPMYGIRLPAPKAIIRILAKLLDKLSANEPWYVLGGTDYKCQPFADNDLTHSQARYGVYRALYQSKPQIQLGSPTNHWLVQALDACERAIEAARSTRVPLLILQAENDTIVDNSGQNDALGGLCQKLVIPGARHEIFIETDERRNQALQAVLAFFERHCVDGTNN